VCVGMTLCDVSCTFSGLRDIVFHETTRLAKQQL